MASEQFVRQYLAYWFQLGKPVLINGGKSRVLPRPILQGDRYSPEFEACWQQVCSPESGDCNLEGTEQTIAELLSPAWDVDPCSRCAMPVPVKVQGVAALECPCIDLPGWPNTELPPPRAPIQSQTRMGQMRDRLRQTHGE